MLWPTNVSTGAYNTAVLNGNASHVKLTFPVQDITLTESNIESSGITITTIMNPDDDIVFGRAISTEVRINFINSSVFVGFDWTEEFKLEFGIEVNNSTDWVTVGYFTGTRPERVKRTEVIEFTAMDRMQKFDEIADDFITATYHNISTFNQKNLYENMCSYLNLSYQQTGKIADSFTNQNYSTDILPSGVTLRTLLAWIAEANGCYAKIAADGKVDIVWLQDNYLGYELTGNQYYNLSINETPAPVVDSIRISSSEDDSLGFVYPTSGTVTYQIVDNPFLLNMTSSRKTSVFTSIVSRFTTLGAYYPSTMTAIGNWMVETGDIFKVNYDSSSVMKMVVFNRILTWNGGCVDEYECIGKSERTTVSDSAKEQYETGGKLKTKYTIQSGVDITDEGITVSGGKYVKIQSGGVLDVSSSNFSIDSDEGTVESGNWKFDDDGLSVRNEVTWQDMMSQSHTSVVDMYFGKNTVNDGADSALYINYEYFYYNNREAVTPTFSLGAIDNSGVSPVNLWNIGVGYEWAADKAYSDAEPGDMTWEPSVNDIWMLGSNYKRYHMAYINKLNGNCLKNDLETEDPYYALDARQGKVLADKLNGFEFYATVGGSTAGTYTKDFTGNHSYFAYVYRSSQGASYMGLYLLHTHFTSTNKVAAMKPIVEPTNGITSLTFTTDPNENKAILTLVSSHTYMYVRVFKIR